MNIKQLPSRLYHTLFDLISPPQCEICGNDETDAADVLCAGCWGKLQDDLAAPACPVCGRSVGHYSLIGGRCHRCQHTRPAVSRLVRVGEYQDTLKALILSFKFRGSSHLDQFFGRLLAAALSGSEICQEIDLLVPVPLHWRRRWSRRYDQAQLLAEQTAHYLNQSGCAVPLCRDMVRIRHTPPQTSLPPSQRLTNLTGAFAIRRDNPFDGRHICLIDDVTTTGSTLRVAARELLKAGAARISAAVIAVAAND